MPHPQLQPTAASFKRPLPVSPLPLSSAADSTSPLPSPASASPFGFTSHPMITAVSHIARESPTHRHPRPRLRRRTSIAGDSVRSDTEGSTSSVASFSGGSLDAGRHGFIPPSPTTNAGPASPSPQPSSSADHLPSAARPKSPAPHRSRLSATPPKAQPGVSPSLAPALPEQPPPTKRTLNKKRLSLHVPPLHCSTSQSIKSCPGSPADPPPCLSATQPTVTTAAMSISSALRGKMEMRRRTSLPKLNLGLASFSATTPLVQPSPSTSTFQPSARQSSDTNRLLGRGAESLNDAMRSRGRSDSFPYEMGPVEILPGLFLGSEQNAKDTESLARLGISAVLNVAKEVDCPWLPTAGTSQAPILEEDEEDEGPAASSTHGGGAPPLRRPPMLAASSKPSSYTIRPASSTPNLQGAFSGLSPVQPSSRRWGVPLESLAVGEIEGRFPLSTLTGSPVVEYVKLPWNHDQSDLCHQFPRVFAFLDRVRNSGGRALVHCQCGVSRSASAIIGYVMACSRSGLEGSFKADLGMHDAYAYVKEKSSWISPNMGLVYQLVEWEKKLRGDGTDEDFGLGRSDDDDKSPSSSGTDSFSDQLSTPSDSFKDPPLTIVVDGMLSPMAEALALGSNKRSLTEKQDLLLAHQAATMDSAFPLSPISSRPFA